jgi:hypothetical protein
VVRRQALLGAAPLSPGACKPVLPDADSVAPRLPLQPCGGAIPLCMVEEFDLPMEIIDRKVGPALAWQRQ